MNINSWNNQAKNLKAVILQSKANLPTFKQKTKGIKAKSNKTRKKKKKKAYKK